MNKIIPLSYFDVLEACAQPGCPLCRVSEKTVNSYLDAILYEMVNDPPTQDTLRQSLGYCNEHAHRLPGISPGVGLGIAIIYRDLINHIIAELQSGLYSPPDRLHQIHEFLDRDKPLAATEAFVRNLQPREPCPACEHRDRMETLALTAMLEALPNDEQMRAALRSSSGLCLPHLRGAFALARNEAAFKTLREIAETKLTEFKADLDEFIRKNDYRFSKEGFGSEGDSWRRAIDWIVGKRGVR
jgi:hypothetical protein